MLFLLVLECREVFADDWNKLKPLKMTSHPLQEPGTWPGKRLECNIKITAPSHHAIRYKTASKTEILPWKKEWYKYYTKWGSYISGDRIVRNLDFIKNIFLFWLTYLEVSLTNDATTSQPSLTLKQPCSATYLRVEKKNQLDVTECFVALMRCSTCFGNFYAHNQEL
jgi:hypothetical protein